MSNSRRLSSISFTLIHDFDHVWLIHETCVHPGQPPAKEVGGASKASLAPAALRTEIGCRAITGQHR
ncbi:hypothetical protein L596_022408 [Steinernema carpocapsae]|uniref:Uncharacterized protein n=1 Tax=Steinernema carpocapsae TaxID=34508 RepID=A0A4U5MLP9_STECR|nr:hypothetical protein L596_022408 [Steinernema carpocapsae]